MSRELARVGPPGRRILKNITARLQGTTGDREMSRSRLFEGSIMPQSQHLSSAIPFVAIERPACPRCKAPMMLARIEPERTGLDQHTFECAVCSHVLKTLSAYDDPMT